MFSSTNDMNTFANFPSASYLSLPPSLICQDSSEIFLHSHHDLLPGALAPVNPQITEYLINMPMLNNPTLTKKVDVIDSLNGDSGFLPQKKPAKRDRHRKICTAQGVRHRRVRLSREIAREFFDLQDMLGFDKASKTLGWLLTESKSAIKEIAKMKSTSGTMPSTPETQIVSEDGDLGRTVSESQTTMGVSKERVKILQKAAIIHPPATDSRENARKRGRERTREKMCTQGIHDLRKFPETGPQISNQFKKSEITHGILPQDVEELGSHQTPREEDIFQESVVIKRKMKQSAILGYQQNTYFPDFSQNWDINGAMLHPTISAATNLNL
ncbi:hypothetical protein SLE2022_189420 [Rubroshorea leprosula]